jgi:hypothetical protein
MAVPLLSSPTHPGSFRDSATLTVPPHWAVSDVERCRWQSFSDVLTGDDDFWQLVVILVGCTVSSIRWTQEILSKIVSPDYAQREQRFTALVTIQKIARLPPSTLVKDLQLSNPQVQSILSSILQPDDICLQSSWTWCPGSTSITSISASLESLGCPLDRQELLQRRRQILSALPGYDVQNGCINELDQYFAARVKVAAELDNPVHDRFSCAIQNIVALSHCDQFTEYLNNWVASAEAEYVIDAIPAELDRQPSHFHGHISHRDNLHLLVAGYEIQRRFFGHERGGDEINPCLPACLTEAGPALYKDAALSYAHRYHLESTLSVLSPSLSLESYDSRRSESWNDFWAQRFPLNPNPGITPNGTIKPDRADGQSSTVDLKSHFSDEDSRSLDGVAFWKMLTSCFSGHN